VILNHILRKLALIFGSHRHFPIMTVDHGGLIWRMIPEAAKRLGTPAPDLAAWRRSGKMTLVKQNLQREIYRVELPPGNVYLKVCRVNTPRAWLRELFRPAKARLEFENALLLAAQGIASIRPLAWGSACRFWPADSYLLTEAAENCVPLQDWLGSRTLTPTERRELARVLAQFFAQLHNAGVIHPDPHPGNLLLESLEPQCFRLRLIDLHAIHFSKSLSWTDCQDNLVLLNRFFQLRATRTDRLRFWRTYVCHRTQPITEADRKARQLEYATTQSNLRFWATRKKRYTGRNREFMPIHGRGVAGFTLRVFPAEARDYCLADPDRLFTDPCARILKDSRTSTVVERTLETSTGAITIVAKRFRTRSLLEQLKNRVRASPALRSWIAGHALFDRDLPTARPLLMLERRRLLGPAEGYVVFEKVPQACELQEWLRQFPETIPHLADKLGRLIRVLHDRQVSHRDLKAPNLLLSGSNAEPVLIDLVGALTGQTVTFRVRVRDLTRFNVSFWQTPEVRHSNRLRFLRAYLGELRTAYPHWKSWWRAIARASQAKIARNQRRHRPIS
jgi:tRNA A-37 threonylcarbamoyl transferase component Bud32